MASFHPVEAPLEEELPQPQPLPKKTRDRPQSSVSWKNKSMTLSTSTSRRPSTFSVVVKRRGSQFKVLEPANPNLMSGSRSVLDLAVLSIKLNSAVMEDKEESVMDQALEDKEDSDSGGEEDTVKIGNRFRRDTSITVESHFSIPSKSRKEREQEKAIREAEEKMLLSSEPVKRTTMEEKIML